MNPDRLAELEEERRFLLSSIRDLDREHAAGDVDEADVMEADDEEEAADAVLDSEVDLAAEAGDAEDEDALALGAGDADEEADA